VLRKVVKEAMENGILANYPIVDMSVTLYDGTYHDVDSSELLLKLPGVWLCKIRFVKPTGAAGAGHESRNLNPR